MGTWSVPFRPRPGAAQECLFAYFSCFFLRSSGPMSVPAIKAGLTNIPQMPTSWGEVIDKNHHPGDQVCAAADRSGARRCGQGTEAAARYRRPGSGKCGNCGPGGATQSSERSTMGDGGLHPRTRTHGELRFLVHCARARDLSPQRRTRRGQARTQSGAGLGPVRKEGSQITREPVPDQ